MSSETYAKATPEQQKLFEEVIQAAQRKEFSVPSLTDGFEKYYWIKHKFRELWDWIQNRLQNTIHIEPSTAALLGEVLKVALIILLVVSVIVLLVLLFKRIGKNTQSHSQGGEALSAIENLSADALQLALHAKDFHLALKLRWKFHLLALGEPRSKTPHELYADTTDEILNPAMQYVYMFGAKPVSAEIYELYNNRLTKIESSGSA